MSKFILKRFLMMIPVLVGVMFITFTINYFTPGDPAQAILGAEATPEAVEALREELGLNDSFIEQFGRYMWGVVTRGDLGTSYQTFQPVLKEITDRYPTTFLLALGSILLATAIGIPLGVVSATRQYSFLDNATMVGTLIGVSMPHFWLGLMLILVFSVNLGIFPASGFYGPSYWVLPIITMSVQNIATFTRMTRSSMLEVIRQDYIRTARAKGLAEKDVITKHALKNALIPVITTIGMRMGAAMGGAVVCETVFTVPGLGKMLVDAIKARNYPVIQGGILFIALAYSFLNLFVDIMYGYIDPRIRSQYGGKKKGLKKEETKKEGGAA